MSRVARDRDDLLLGEWACLGILCAEPSHGFAVSVRLRPSGDVGRVWSLSRPLTYRAIDRLIECGYVAPIASEPGIAGGNRTILGITTEGRDVLNDWLDRPVRHLRDLRSELLLKLQLARTLGVDSSTLIESQRRVVSELRQSLASSQDGDDIVSQWRIESADAALRFLDALVTPRHRPGSASE